MQICQIPFLTPLDQNILVNPRASGRPWIKTLSGTKSSYNLILGRVYFMPKTQNGKFTEAPTFGGPLGPGGLGASD